MLSNLRLGLILLLLVQQPKNCACANNPISSASPEPATDIAPIGNNTIGTSDRVEEGQRFWYDPPFGLLCRGAKAYRPWTHWTDTEDGQDRRCYSLYLYWQHCRTADWSAANPSFVKVWGFSCPGRSICVSAEAANLSNVFSDSEPKNFTTTVRCMTKTQEEADLLKKDEGDDYISRSQETPLWARRGFVKMTLSGYPGGMRLSMGAYGVRGERRYRWFERGRKGDMTIVQEDFQVETGVQDGDTLHSVSAAYNIDAGRVARVWTYIKFGGMRRNNLLVQSEFAFE